MPELVNNLEHPVRVRDDDGETVRVVPGQIVSVDGRAADELSAIEGLDTPTDEDRDAWEARNQLTSAVDSGKESLQNAYAALRVRGKASLTAVPLNQIVGDNDAPIGPPSGTITTKQAVARLGPAEKRAFADHERLPEEASNEGLSDVERAQAEAKALVEDIHNEVLEEAQAAGNESATLEPTSEGALATEGQVVTGEGDSEPPPEESPNPSPSSVETTAPSTLRGQALDDALTERGLSTSGTVAEKQQRLSDFDASQ
jgi:hypothetical protein